MGRLPTVELIYDRRCPNVDRARAMIRNALHAVGADAIWREWDRESAETPDALRHFGSPTVLVNGRDVDSVEHETAQADANACRVYADPADGCLRRAPSSDLIVGAIQRSRDSR